MNDGNQKGSNNSTDLEADDRITQPGTRYPGAVSATPPLTTPDFAKGSIFRPILRMGLPSIIGFLSVNIYDIADMFWVAKLGAGHVAAIALFEGFYWVLIASNDIAGLGSVAIISRRYGEGKLDHTAAAIKETFILKWICALISGIIGLIFLRPLMIIMGAQGEVIDLGVQYGRIHMIALGFYFCSYSVFTSLRSVEAPMMAMALMLFGAIFNMFLDPLLIFGVGPFPRLGIAGAAWASAISHTLTLAIGLFIFFSRYSPVRLHWKGQVPVRFKTMIHMMKVGLPGGVNTVSFSLARAVITPLVALFGTAVVAAYGVAMRITLMPVLVIFGLGLGVSPLIGNLLGAGFRDRVWKTARQSILLSMGITAVISVVMFALAPQIIEMFFSDKEILNIAVELLRIWALGLPFIAIWIMSESIFHGAGDNIPPMLISIIASWVVEIPLVLLVTVGLGLDQTAVWWARFFYFFIGATCIYYWLRRGKWIEKKV